MPFINRRSFLTTTLLPLTFALARPALVLAQETASGISLTAEEKTYRLDGKRFILGYGFSTADGSATLRLQKGVAASLKIINRLPFALRLVFQGIRNQKDDSIPALPAGEETTFSITPPDSGTFIYRAADQDGNFIAGFCGFVIVEEAPEADSAIGLNTAHVGFTPLPHFRSFQDAPPALGAVWTQALLPPQSAALPAGASLRLRFANFSLDRVAALTVSGTTNVQVIAMDGQPCPRFPPFENRLALPPSGRIDAVLHMENQDVHIVNPETPDKPLLSIAFSGKQTVPSAYAHPDSNPLLPGPIPLEKAVRAQWDLAPLTAHHEGTPENNYLFQARTGDSIALAIHNPTDFPYGFTLQGHSARLLDALDDGWKPWWHDSLYVPPKETVRLVFRAGEAGRYGLSATRLNGTAPPQPLRHFFRIYEA